MRPTLAAWEAAVPARTRLSPIVVAAYALDGATPRMLHVCPYADLNERTRVRGEAVSSGIWPPKGGPDWLTSCRRQSACLRSSRQCAEPIRPLRNSSIDTARQLNHAQMHRHRLACQGRSTAQARRDIGRALRRDRGLRERPHQLRTARRPTCSGWRTDRGLGIDLYQPFRDLDAAIGRTVHAAISIAPSASSTSCRRSATPMMLVCSNVAADTRSTDDARIAAQLYELAERAATPQPPDRLRGAGVGSPRQPLRACVVDRREGRSSAPRHRHRQLPHPVARRRSPDGIAAIPGDKIFFLQMADAPRLAMDVLQWSRHYRCFPGPGPVRPAALPRAGAHRRLHRTVLARDLQRRVPRGAQSAARRSTRCSRILYLRVEQTRLRLESADDRTASARPPSARARTARARRALRSARPAPRLAGVAFLEFAVDEASEWLLDNVLETLGFRRVGRHRSKNVTLYRQGLDPPDPQRRAGFVRAAAFRRATDRRSARSSLDDRRQRAARSTGRRRCTARATTAALGPHELRASRRCARRMAASSTSSRQRAGVGRDVRDRLRPDDAGAGSDAKDAGLTRIDHVAMGVARRVRSTRGSLFCRAVLGHRAGREPRAVRSVRPRAQHAASRAPIAQVRDGAQRLAEPQHGRWRARSPSQGGGASVHHIAFATRRHLRRRWPSCVRNGAQVRADLAAITTTTSQARFDLPGELVARMREARHPLRAHAGRRVFPRVLARASPDRFFFEIVQRGGDYDGYGALNAPARLASQVAGRRSAQ